MAKLKNISSFLIFILAVTSLSAQEAVPYNSNTEGLLDFYLPKASVKLLIRIEKHTYTESNFDIQKAADYLPVNTGNHSSKSYYQIKDLELITCYERDESRHFILKNAEKAKIFFNNESVITGINIKGENQQCPSRYKTIKTMEKTPRNYNNFFIKKNFKTVNDTIYKIVKNDSIVFRKPVVIPKIKEKNEKDKLYDLVHYLIKTRKRKFRLISGLDTINYNPEVFKMKLKNLDSLEASLYTSLTGNESRELVPYIFDIDLTKKTDTLAYFSPNQGITTDQGTPIVVEINRTDYKKSNSNGKGMPYIIPDKVTLKVSASNLAIYSEKILVPQWGQLKFVHGKIAVLQYGKAGNIQHIEFK